MAKDSSGLGVFQKLWKFSGLSRKYFIRKKGWDRCKKIGTRNILQDSRLCKQFLGVFGLERFSTKALFPLCGELRAIYVCTIVHSLEEKKVHVRICRLECFMFLGLFLFGTSNPEVLCNPKNPNSFQFTLVFLSVQPARLCHSGQEPSKWPPLRESPLNIVCFVIIILLQQIGRGIKRNKFEIAKPHELRLKRKLKKSSPQFITSYMLEIRYLQLLGNIYSAKLKIFRTHTPLSFGLFTVKNLMDFQ